MRSKPFFSAILPTTDRRLPFLPLAFEGLTRQREIDLEVIIVSEDEKAREAARKLIEQTGILGSVHESPRDITIGLKRNVACEHAQGEWITFWDDDDWSREDRLVLTRNQCRDDIFIVGSQTMLIHELIDSRRRTAAYQYQPPKGDSSYPPRFFVGGLLAFQKALWKKYPFENSRTGEEAWWQMRLKHIPAAEMTIDPTVYVSMLHGQNTAYIQASLPYRDPSITLWNNIDSLRTLMGKDVLERYEKASKSLIQQTT